MLKDEKELGDYMSEKSCDRCGAHRLKLESLSVHVASRNIGDILDMPIDKTLEFFKDETKF